MSFHERPWITRRPASPPATPLTRRQVLKLATTFGVGAGLLQVIGCSKNENPSQPRACTAIPQESVGGHPGDGTDGGFNILAQPGVVRSDIRASFNGPTGVADGVPLTILLTVVSAASCAARAGSAVYLWQADRLGRYSLYTPGITAESYLRGVQETDASGKVTFVSIFPGVEAGRWPHLHIEVFESLAVATNGSNRITASQIALPRTACEQVYATATYSANLTAFSQLALNTDPVFSDSSMLELATVGGDVNAGMTAALTIAV